ncbi:MAG: sugar ABC transporter substrate-binding protein [bacterium]|nr:sugar ABC transporter substrate-binding protein [Candidatus Kapabacteria bacterium]
MYNRVSPLLAFSLMIIASASGCGDDKTDSGGRKRVVITHFWGDVQDVWQQAIDEFKKSHPDIDVEQQAVSFNVHFQKVQTASAAGSDIGDLVLLEDWFAQELMEREQFIDLQPMVARDLDTSQIFSISLKPYRHGASLQAFPVALGTYPLFYNKDIFDKANERYPDSTWTYDTLLAVAKRLTIDKDGDGKTDQYGFLLDNSGGFDGVLYSLGGAVLTDDGTRSAFAEPRTINALKYWVDLVQVHKVAPPNASMMGGSASGGSLRPFETGRFAMAILQAALSTYRSVPFKWDIAKPPKGPAGRKVLRYGAAFGIPKGSKNAEAAWEFLRWMIEDMPAKYVDRMFYGQVPNSRRLASADEYLNGDPKVNRTVVIDLIDNESFAYYRSRWLQFRDQGFLPELDLMVLGEKPVEQAANDADRRINEVLAQ